MASKQPAAVVEAVVQLDRPCPTVPSAAHERAPIDNRPAMDDRDTPRASRRPAAATLTA
jgi:hypothetical protein